MKRMSFPLNVFAVSLLLASTAVFAHHHKSEYKGESDFKCETPCNTCSKTLHEGFYAGFSFGHDGYRVRENFDVSDGDSGFLQGNPPINGTGWVPELFAGYSAYWCRFYLGGELYLNMSTTDNATYGVADNVASYNNKFEARTGYGVAIIPGYKLNRTTLVYLRGSYNWLGVDTEESISTNSPSRFNNSNTIHGLGYGVGMETALCNNWSVRAEYNHLTYNTITSGLDTSFEPYDNRYSIGLVYHLA